MYADHEIPADYGTFIAPKSRTARSSAARTAFSFL
jgi:hypothetical protein